MRTYMALARERIRRSAVLSATAFTLLTSLFACLRDGLVAPRELDLTRSTLIVAPGPHVSGQLYGIFLTARDADGNTITKSVPVAFTMSGGTSAATLSPVTNLGPGGHVVVFTATKAGTPTNVTATIPGKGDLIATQPITVVPGTADPFLSFNRGSTQRVPLGGTATFTVTVRDRQENVRTAGGDTVAFEFSPEASPTGVTADGTFSSVRDNRDGTYTTTFTGTRVGGRYISASVNGVALRGTNPGVSVLPPPD